MSGGKARVPDRSRRRESWRPEPLASFVAAAELLTSDLLAGALTSSQLKTVIRQVVDRVGLPPRAVLPALHALVARDTRFLTAESTVAAGSQLKALILFSPITHASLWQLEADEPVCVAREGTSPRLRQLRSLARRTAEADPRHVDGKSSVLRAIPVDLSGALLLEVKARWTARALEFAGETALVLGPLLQRLATVDAGALEADQLLDAADRRVARIGLDIHDGPLQGLALLGSELALFERQIEQLIPDDPSMRIALRRVADLIEMTTTVGKELREIASAGVSRRLSLRDSVDQAVRQFESKNGARVRLTIEGDIERTTPSQRIAVARVVEEALANVAEHSRATGVDVILRRDQGLLSLSVVDNGRGFDVARTRRRASRDRRLGLAVMGERIRLLGGRLRIDSRPGGPTTVSASLAVWDAALGSQVGPSGAVRSG